MLDYRRKQRTSSITTKVAFIVSLILCNLCGCCNGSHGSSSTTSSLVVNGKGSVPSQQRTTRFHSAFVTVGFNLKNNRHQGQNKYHHQQQQQQRQLQPNKKDCLDRKNPRFFHSTQTFATSSSQLWMSSSTETEETSSPSPQNSISDTSFIDDQKPKFTIRKCEYSDLNAVADIIMEAFYTKPSPFKGIYRIAELNRLQQNYPYADLDLHQMVVAEAANATSSAMVVVGFADVDCRPCKTKPILPRPYISDLAVSNQYRRQGIAKSLVQYCESFIQDVSNRDDVFIRVETNNTPAINMYNNMNYDTIRDEYCKISKSQLYVLYKNFTATAAPTNVDESV